MNMRISYAHRPVREGGTLETNPAFFTETTILTEDDLSAASYLLRCMMRTNVVWVEISRGQTTRRFALTDVQPQQSSTNQD
jgi:hypothetical protein